MDLVPAVTQDPDQEHLEKAVVTDQLQCDLPPLSGELLAAIAVMPYESLRREAGDHLADARRRDAEALREVARRHRALVAAQQVEGFEVVLLGPREDAAALELLDHLGSPNRESWPAYH